MNLTGKPAAVVAGLPVLQKDGMHFRFFLSAPQGDIELSPEELQQPFLISPTEKHPFLTLKDYFGALQKFILSGDGKYLHAALEKIRLPGSNSPPADISEIHIHSEKHGAYYHIASIKPAGFDKNVKLAVTTALAHTAKVSLQKEFLLLQQLSKKNSEFLPALFYKKSVPWQTDSGEAEFYMVLGEWLADYHEWHISDNPAEKKQQIQLWDYEKGYRFLSDAESHDIIRQAAYILTSCYDQVSYRQVYPWHHGAGDFVVKADTGTIQVKLITVRQYEPLVHFAQTEEHDRLVAAIQFLLNLSLRMRLDRIDGVGEPGWLDAYAVQGAVAGFFAGLGDASKTNSLFIGPMNEFLEILRSFDTREIYDMYESLLQIYADEDQDDFRLIREKLTDHAADLRKALQDFSLGSS